MMSYINRTRGVQRNQRMLHVSGVGANDGMSEKNESVAPSQLGLEANNGNDGAILFTPAALQPKKKHKAPQDAIDEFWDNFNTKTPGK